MSAGHSPSRGDLVRVHLIVTGRVQGVWYRQSCKEVAVAAGVHGWVRNTADGRVEAVLEGERDAVDAVIGWMRVGPPHAVVDDVQLTVEPPEGARTFAVR
ncbi:MAG: acylphosphatase [Acidimicrobiales bacterium]